MPEMKYQQIKIIVVVGVSLFKFLILIVFKMKKQLYQNSNERNLVDAPWYKLIVVEAKSKMLILVVQTITTIKLQ